MSRSRHVSLLLCVICGLCVIAAPCYTRTLSPDPALEAVAYGSYTQGGLYNQTVLYVPVGETAYFSSADSHDEDSWDDPHYVSDTVTNSGWQYQLDGDSGWTAAGVVGRQVGLSFNQAGEFYVRALVDDLHTAPNTSDDYNFNEIIWGFPGAYGSSWVTVYVFGGDYTFDRSEVHYYCGSPVPSDNCAHLIAPAQPPGTTVTWSATGPGRFCESPDDNHRTLEDYGASGPDKNDIVVTLTYSLSGATCSYTHTFTSLKPQLTNGPRYDDNAVSGGYLTHAVYDIVDQYGMAISVVAAETFDNDRHDDYTGNTWNNPAEQNITTPYSALADSIGYTDGTNPVSVGPNDLGAGVSVFWHTQCIHLGWLPPAAGGGVEHSVIQHYYRGYGRHE